MPSSAAIHGGNIGEHNGEIKRNKVGKNQLIGTQKSSGIQKHTLNRFCPCIELLLSPKGVPVCCAIDPSVPTRKNESEKIKSRTLLKIDVARVEMALPVLERLEVSLASSGLSVDESGCSMGSDAQRLAVCFTPAMKNRINSSKETKDPTISMLSVGSPMRCIVVFI